MKNATLSLRLLGVLLLAALLVACAGPSGGSSGRASGERSGSASGSASGTASGSTASPGSSAPGGSLPRFLALSGPTGVGAAKMMQDPQAHFTSCGVAVQNDEVTAQLVSGEADIGALATNVAATLAARTEGGVQVLAVNTLGVLYVLEKGDTVQDVADLAGKTLLAPSTARGANPEYILRELLKRSGADPDAVDLQWLTPQEISARMVSSEAGVCLLPEPAATALLLQDPDIREAVSLSRAWETLCGSVLPMGCVVARTAYLEENPGQAEVFLEAYGASLAWMQDDANREEAAALVADLGIAPSAEVAAAAIPRCSLTFLTGSAMRKALEDYYAILYGADPASVGGSLPGDGFYYGA